jgi:RNA polymerase-binding transcription factor DksA
MSDDADFSSQLEIDEHQRIFKDRALKQAEEKKLLGQVRIECGVKYCIDCEEEILPKARSQLAWVARCIDCQEFLERESKSYN